MAILNWPIFGSTGIDGSTVLPVDDVQTWLKCANQTYTGQTAAEVCADSTLCAALMNSANAVNYLVRSATLQTSALASSTAIAALDASSPISNPLMTSNTEPYGTASASRSYNTTTRAPWCAFATSSVSWATQSNYGTLATDYVEYAFPSGTEIWIYKVSLDSFGTGTFVTTGTLQALVDGTWTSISDKFTVVASAGVKTFVCNAHIGRATAFRMLCSAGTYAGPCQMFVSGK